MSNGKKSILSTEKYYCYRCGEYGPTERHHIFGGANRKFSEKYGLTVYLCPKCHNIPPDGVHFNKENMDWLHRIGQTAFESQYVKDNNTTFEEARQRFMEIFGKNYL